MDVCLNIIDKKVAVKSFVNKIILGLKRTLSKPAVAGMKWSFEASVFRLDKQHVLGVFQFRKLVTKRLLRFD